MRKKAMYTTSIFRLPPLVIHPHASYSLRQTRTLREASKARRNHTQFLEKLFLKNKSNLLSCWLCGHSVHLENTQTREVWKTLGKLPLKEAAEQATNQNRMHSLGIASIQWIPLGTKNASENKNRMLDQASNTRC